MDPSYPFKNFFTQFTLTGTQELFCSSQTPPRVSNLEGAPLAKPCYHLPPQPPLLHHCKPRAVFFPPPFFSSFPQNAFVVESPPFFLGGSFTILACKHGPPRGSRFPPLKVFCSFPARSLFLSVRQAPFFFFWRTLQTPTHLLPDIRLPALFPRLDPTPGFFFPLPLFLSNFFLF